MTTRFAPSLTGYLHLGHVLHMLHVWGAARAVGARVVCRIEDHDLSRRRAEYERAILADMAWLGFVPDLGIPACGAPVPSEYRQGDCAERYAGVLGALERRGLAYGCRCTRKEIAARQPAGVDEPCYDGACAGRGLPLEGHAVRFRVPQGEVAFRDMRLGEQRQRPARQCGDFALRDRGGQWTYQFCCVCDDVFHGIGLVVRGEDILPSTGRQILLFHALGKPAPAYFHHPLLRDASGAKLGKRQRSESLARMREDGAAPADILGRAAFAAGLLPAFRPLALGDALALVAAPALPVPPAPGISLDLGGAG